MKLDLLKKLDVFFNDKFIEQNESNYKKIEEAINENDSDLTNHKTTDLNAHNSKQISHENTTVYKMLIYQMERIRNLVLGVDGDGIKEVTDSRVSIDGKKHGLLSERLFYDLNKTNEKIEKVDKKSVEINFDTFNPDKTGETPANLELQEALDQIRDAGAGTLVIKNGTYLINKRLTVYSNTTIKMEENAVLLRGNARAILDFGDINDVFYGYDGVKNIHIIGGTLDCNLEQINKYPTDAANMVNIRHANNVSFYNVKFRNTLSYHAIDANGVNNLSIKNCIFEGYKNLNGAELKEAIQISEMMQGGVGGSGAWDGTPCKNVAITGCTFRASDIAPSFQVAIGNHASIHDVFQENFKITNNIFEDCYIGIRPFKWVNVEISGNIFDRNTICVRIAAANNSKNVKGVQSNKAQAGNIYHIKENIFRDYTLFGVCAVGEVCNDSFGYVGHIRINDNTFMCENNGNSENILLSLCRHIQIKGNHMSYGYRGMNIDGSHNIFIDNNYIEHMKTEAIYINRSGYEGYAQETKHLNITNNTINSTGKNGCYVQNSRYVYIAQNRILNTSLFTGDKVTRGGLYLNDCRNGRIESNDFWETGAFAILGASLTNFIAFNNGGSGVVQLFGDATSIGYYNVNSKNNIVKRDTKGDG
ncbi:right-handed parallel beta-helix repeat-containing protein [Staphylococcus americanisciuri]|uniref:Right-handed parallel beta-helix repeat-containing protein n=1 Tax=Staphylococcus americanisciuri TaxID=2973940 RepID=A0ABT2F3X8_9STAP|nr:right-handed parallel beta-helix repeat-containing protein [Staphylococcus americanisciuri]MCS4487186.1 right-handed parallel beta-helix repeat-containing protein [Staphylococcus americanisciuri]